MTTGVSLFSATVISVQVGARTLEKDLEETRRRNPEEFSRSRYISLPAAETLIFGTGQRERGMRTKIVEFISIAGCVRVE